MILERGPILPGLSTLRLWNKKRKEKERKKKKTLSNTIYDILFKSRHFGDKLASFKILKVLKSLIFKKFSIC